MKSPESLRRSYDSQRQIFELARAKKSENYQKELKKIQEEKLRLQKREAELLALIQQNNSRSFRTFEEFVEEQQRNSQTAKKILQSSTDTSTSN